MSIITRIEERIEASYWLSTIALTLTGLAGIGLFSLVNLALYGETL